ncbi:MAG: ABC transporter permease [Candidatus Alcyoniella australis]|nr:ABC transporter permease [Candidatus Alcyoniella australis]
MGRILQMTRKEFIQVFRDMRMVAILFVAPILQLFIFGYAVTTDVRNISLAVMDLDHSSTSRAMVEAVVNSGYFNLAGAVENDQQIERTLVRGLADVVLVIPQGYKTDLESGRRATVQILLDGGESNSANVAMGYLGKIFAAQGMREVQGRMAALSAMAGGAQISLPIITTEVRYRFNPELRSSWYMVPGVLAMILMITVMMLSSMAITREREVGTMEQLAVTPIKPWQLLAGKMLPFAIIGMVNVTLILIVGVGHFGLPIVGSLALLYFAALTFLFATLGMGLLISTMADTQQQALFVSLLVNLPAIMLSGFMFPIENMPYSIQLLTYLNPMRYFLVIVRSIILKGAGWAVLAPQFGMLAVLGLALFWLASLRFRKTV